MGLTGMIISEIGDEHSIEDNSDIYLIARGGRRGNIEKRHITLESFYNRRPTAPGRNSNPNKSRLT